MSPQLVGGKRWVADRQQLQSCLCPGQCLSELDELDRRFAEPGETGEPSRESLASVRRRRSTPKVVMDIPVSAGESPVALAESESRRSHAIPAISPAVSAV